ncbi:FDLD family class I lanthipeptide [Streptomyces smyrnaeus]|uniref:FDLD family class I lanthipeptide n=1 Tax=Streptomyces smyrnaeus TaxID=1387713 RepID=UPI0036B6A2B2
MNRRTCCALCHERAPTTAAVRDSVDPFDLDIIVVESSEPGSAVPASAGGCGATCSSGSCDSSGA